jgi:predicted small lipoprotein YifL
MRPTFRLPLLALLVALIAGCGFKGDLVQPGEEAVPEKAEPAQRDPVQG